MMWWPTAGEPVKTRWLKGRCENACACATSPPKTATSSSAKPSASIFASNSVERGDSSDILIITRLPAASAATSGPTDRYSGKFHAPMTPTTPLGW